MKFTLVALVFISLSVFANSRDNQIDLNLIKTYQEINGNTVKITKSFKGNSLNTHICKEVIKKSKNGKKKKRVVKKKKYKNGKLVRKVRRVVFFDENGKKSFKGPLKLQEIENNNPNILTIEIDSKNIKNTDIEKFIPFKAKYKIFDPAVNFKDRRGKTLANLYEVAGKKRFDINLADIETGDHDLFVRIVSNKSRHLNRKKKRKPLVKFVHTASIEFTKSVIESAHIVAEVVEQVESNSRIVFDLSNSYSDAGEIVKYQIKAFKDNELIQNEEVSANELTHLRYFFTEHGEYKFEFTVFDSLGDSDTFVSDLITPSAIVPDLKYTIVQNPEYPSIFKFDFSETITPEGVELSHFTVLVRRGDEDLEAYGIGAENPIKELSLQSRGDIDIVVVVDTTLGDVNYELARSLNLADSIPHIQVLDYSYQYVDGDNPFIYNYAFQRNFNEEEIDYFEYVLVKDGNETTTKASHNLSDPNAYQVQVSYPGNGDYELIIKLIKKDGSISYPYKKSESINIDLGQAHVDIELSIINAGLTLEFVFKPESSSPGNYGYFSGFFCSGTNTQTNEQMNFETIDNYTQYEITRGAWNFECFGKTTAGLESNKVSFNLESINQAPIAGLELTAHIPGKKSITVHTSSEDRDGSVQAFELNIQAPSGDIETLNITGDLNITLFEVGVHYFSYRVQDNEGLWSELIHKTYEVINDKPIANINITPIGNTGSKEVQFSFSASDADGNIVTAQTTITTPSGSVHEYPWGINEEIDFTFWEIGTHSITYKVQDNDGAWSELDSIIYETINIKPLASLEIIPSAPGSRDIVMRQSASDSDGNIIRTLTTLTLPDGEYQEFEQGLGDFDFSFWQDGTHIIGFSVQDNDGDWSEISTVSYEVVSQYSAPIAEIIINPATGSDRVITVTLGHSDTDGEVVEGGLIHRNSNGHEVYYDYLEGDYPININEIGTHEFRYFVIDNDGNRSEDVFATYTFESNVPYPSYELTATEVSGEYQYTPTYTDPDNLISYPELALFGPDGSWQGFDGSAPRILNLKQLGEWKIVLSFFTHDGMRSDSNFKYIQIDDLNRSPVAVIKTNNNGVEVKQFDIVEFSALDSNDPDGDLLEFKWVFPNGEEKTDTVVFHHFEEVGVAEVKLIVTDSKGLSNEAVVEINVLDMDYGKPTIDINLSGNFDENDQLVGELTLDSGDTKSVEGRITNYLWEVSNGFISELETARLNFDTPGLYRVKLTATTEFGASSSKEVEVFVVTAIDPKTVKSEYNYTISGISREERNPIINEIIISVPEASSIQPDLSLLVNEVSIDLERISSNSFRASFEFVDGTNELEILGYDENNNYISTFENYTAGSINKTISLKNSSGVLISDTEIKITMLNQSVEDIIVRTNLNGEADLYNIPDLAGMIIVGTPTGNLKMVKGLGDGIDNLVLSELESPSIINNNDYSDGINGWEIIASSTNVEIDDITGENNLVVEINNTDGALIKRTFISDKDGFVSLNLESLGIPSTSKVSISLVNSSSGKSWIRHFSGETLSQTSDLRPWIASSINDIINLEIKVNGVEASVFNKIFGFEAYASTLSFFKLSEILQNTYLFNFTFMDLNLAKEDTSTYNLTPLTRLSIGNYLDIDGEGKNPIYGHLEVDSFGVSPVVKINSMEMIQGENVLDLTSRIDFDIKSLIEAESGFSGVASSYTESVEGSKPFTSENKNDFKEFFSIPSNSFNPNEKIHLAFTFTVTVDGKEHVNTFSKAFNSDFILVDNKVRENENNIYGFRDNTFPNYGDFWSTLKTKDVQTKLLSIDKLGLKLGDTTNINGALEKKSFFDKHQWHHDGKRFDARTRNFPIKLDDKMRFEPFWDLKNILERQNGSTSIHKAIIHVPKSDLLEEHLSSYCLKGKTIGNLYKTYQKDTSKGLKGIENSSHNDHWHFKLEYNSTAELDYANNELKNKISEISKPVGEDGFSSREFEVSDSNLDFYIHILKQDANGKVNLLYDSLSSENESVEIGSTFPDTDGGETAVLRVQKVLSNKFIMKYSENFEMSNLDGYIVYLSVNDPSLTPPLDRGENVGSPSEYNKYTCGDQEMSLIPTQVTDCNLDGEHNDPAYINSAGGIIGLDVEIDDGLVNSVSNSARVCGSSKISASALEISGLGILVEDTFIDNSCSWVSIQHTSGHEIKDITKREEYSLILNSEICTEPVIGPENSFYFQARYNARFSDDSNEIVGSKLNGRLKFRDTSIYNSEIGVQDLDSSGVLIGDPYDLGKSTVISGGSGRIYRTKFIRSTWILPYRTSFIFPNESLNVTPTIEGASIFDSELEGYLLISYPIHIKTTTIKAPTFSYEFEDQKLHKFSVYGENVKIENSMFFGNTDIMGTSSWSTSILDSTLYLESNPVRSRITGVIDGKVVGSEGEYCTLNYRPESLGIDLCNVNIFKAETEDRDALFHYYTEEQLHKDSSIIRDYGDEDLPGIN